MMNTAIKIASALVSTALQFAILEALDYGYLRVDILVEQEVYGDT